MEIRHLFLFAAAFFTTPIVFCQTIRDQQGKWLRAGNIFESIAFPLRSPVIQLIHQISQNADIGISKTCRSSLMRFAKDLHDQETNAMHMLDSFGKFTPGILKKRRLTDFGHYEQCLSVENGRYLLLEYHWPAPSSIDDLNTLFQDEISPSRPWIKDYSSKMRTCTMYMVPPMIGICVPRACSNEDLTAVIESSLIRNQTHPFNILMKSSESRDPGEDNFPDYKLIRVISRSILYLLVLVTLISTLIAAYAPGTRRTNAIVGCFDAFKTCVKLFDDVSEQNQSLRFFHGVKIIYVIVVLGGHLLLPLNTELTPYFHEIKKLVEEQLWLRIGSKGCSTLLGANFVMASSLSVISWMPELTKRQGKISFTQFVSIRIFRTMPVTLACLFFIYSLPLIPSGGGPNLNVVQRNMTTNCIKNGWKELLFVSNHDSPSDICLVVGWYMSADFQLYILSFFVIYFLYHNEKLAVRMIVASIICGPIIQFAVMYYKNVQPTVMMFSTNNPRGLWDLVQVLHFHAFNYISSYGLGLLLGYAIVKKYRVPEPYLNVGWRLSLVLLFGTLFLPDMMYDDETFVINSRVLEVLFGSLIRTVMITGFCGVMLLGFSDSETAIVQLLSTKPFTVLSRMSFSVFMVHPFVFVFLVATKKHAVDYDLSQFLMFAFFLILASFFFGFFLFICVEAPFVNVTKLFLPARGHKKRMPPIAPVEDMRKDVDDHVEVQSHKACIKNLVNNNSDISYNNSDPARSRSEKKMI